MPCNTLEDFVRYEGTEFDARVQSGYKNGVVTLTIKNTATGERRYADMTPRVAVWVGWRLICNALCAKVRA